MTHTTRHCTAPLVASPLDFTAQLLHIVREWFAVQALKRALRAERAALAQLSDAALRDIGIDRVIAETEAARTDIPASRLR